MAIDNLQENDSHKDFHIIKQALFNLLEQTQDLELSPEKIQALLRLGRLIILSNQHFSTAEYNTLQGKAYELLKRAWHLAQQTNNRAGISQALGYKGQLYQHEKRYQEALNLTRQAVFFAQELPELLYYWQWQMASIFQEQGEHAKSALAYKQAIDTLWSIRYDLSKIYRTFRSSFREQVSALFYEFTELLLTYASRFSREEKKALCRLQEQPADCLKKLQDTLEKLKSAELLDYFQNECVIKNQISLTEIGLEKETAVLYPIMLKDRLELLLHKAGGMTLISVTETNRQKLEDEIYHLRHELNHGEHLYHKFKKHAQNLYDWLIHPLKESNHLQDIETLVLVPDGQLRTMPIAALHDGKDYLIEHYALAVVPGLTLRVTSEQEPTNQSILLLTGLDLEEPVNIRGYTLDVLNTADEVEGIKKHISKSVELLNQDFTETNLKEKLIETGYSMVHISSHAVFEADINNSFILMSQVCPLELEPFQDLLTLNRIHDTPLNLITLSACETALGDDRAALGLGGVALRAGAQSAVATLWKVKPDFTTRFMPIFYENISKGLSKAKALQETQKAMIKSDYYQHPYFWYSFTLIGNGLK
jgi:CHAT domain-containing protein